MSTGVITLEELEESVDYLRQCGCKQLILLKCTSTYPASAEDSHLRTISDMQERFGCFVGVSDHTLGVGVSLAAVACGAKVIEKHLTLRRSDGGVDATFSLEPEEFKVLVEESQKAFLALGKVNYLLGEKEKKSRMFKRSIFVVEPVKKGQMFEPRHLKVIRPAEGLPSKYYEQVIGQKAACDIYPGTALEWSMVVRSEVQI
jgi:N-acetylneuraminate synthase